MKKKGSGYYQNVYSATDFKSRYFWSAQRSDWKWFKVDKGGAHSLCKSMQLYAFWTWLSFLIVKLHSFLPKDAKKNHIKIQIMTR